MEAWRKLSRHDLARDTLRRAGDLDELVTEAWRAMTPAFASSIPAVVVLAEVILYGLSWPRGVLLCVLATPPVFFGWRWLKAVDACDRFSEEMRARRARLKRAE